MSLSGSEIDLVLAGFADSTRRSYDTAWKKFVEFCSSQGFEYLPSSSVTVVKFIRYEFDQGISSAALRVYIAGIGAVHKLKGFTDPCSCFLVKNALKGVGRLRPAPPDSRSPILKDHMIKILKGFDIVTNSEFERAAFRAVLCLLYAGWFRIQELISSSKLRPDARLRRNGIVCSENSIVVTLSSDKTSVGRQRKVSVPVTKDKIDILTSITFYRGLSDSIVDNDSPFFVHSDGTPISVGQFRPLLSNVLKMMGLPTSITPHSFRIGGASGAAQAGESLDSIMRQGRWTSNAVSRYIRHV